MPYLIPLSRKHFLDGMDYSHYTNDKTHHHIASDKNLLANPKSPLIVKVSPVQKGWKEKAEHGIK